MRVLQAMLGEIWARLGSIWSAVRGQTTTLGEVKAQLQEFGRALANVSAQGTRTVEVLNDLVSAAAVMKELLLAIQESQKTDPLPAVGFLLTVRDSNGVVLVVHRIEDEEGKDNFTMDLKVSNEIEYELVPVDKFKNPTTVDGPVKFDADPALMTVVASEDGLKGTATPVGPANLDTVITFRADSDLDPNSEKVITSTLSIHLLPGDAAEFLMTTRVVAQPSA